MSIKHIKLNGSYFEMGASYGNQLKPELQDALSKIKDYFITTHGLSYKQLANKAQLFYNRYSTQYKFFLEGIHSATGLSADDVNILNGMETLNSLVSSIECSPDTDVSACAFVFIPPNKSSYDSAIIGRNYDFPEPYTSIAQHIIVTTLSTAETSDITIIGMPGQIYCPTCVSDKGLFAELNNGMPSGGYYDDLSRESMLSNMMKHIQSSNNFEELGMKFRATESDYSLIINTANTTHAVSYEYSTTLGMKKFTPEFGKAFVSTNFFQNTTWGNQIPQPIDAKTWMGVTRRDNLMNLSNSKEVFSIEDFQKLMDTSITDGGACWPSTIYQIIFSEQDLYIRSTGGTCEGDWDHIDLS